MSSAAAGHGRHASQRQLAGAAAGSQVTLGAGRWAEPAHCVQNPLRRRRPLAHLFLSTCFSPCK